MANFSRRAFLYKMAAGAGLAWAGLLGSTSLARVPGLAAAGAATARSAPCHVVAEGDLVNLQGQRLNFGTSIYPFRAKNRPEWLLQECKALGLTEIRLSFPREHCEHGPNSGAFDPQCFKNPNPEVTDMLRQSGLDIIMLVSGHPADRHGHPLEWLRNQDGSIDGRANAASFANYARWLANHTKDFVGTYELWNEAFGHVDDPHFKKSFGPGGSLANADNYSAMMLPALFQIRKHAPAAAVAVEGNFWNIKDSVGQSPGMQRLLQEADYVIMHPYDYLRQLYEGGEHPGRIFEATPFYRNINERLDWWFSEYGVSASRLGVPACQVKGLLQAKAVLRATLLHLRHRIEHLDVFALFYPTSPAHTLCDADFSRRPAWYTHQRLIAACAPGKKSINGQLIRKNPLEPRFADLSVATPSGFTYCLWQESEPATFKDQATALPCRVHLQSSDGRPLALASVVDPLTGGNVTDITATRQDGCLVLNIPVLDYPFLCRIE